MRVLMVEDSERDVALVTRQLAELGRRRGARRADAGRARRRPTLIAARPPDGVLLDLVLPDADGLDGARRAARRRARAAVVVLLTGWAQDDVALRAVRTGAQDCLVKGETPGPRCCARCATRWSASTPSSG